MLYSSYTTQTKQKEHVDMDPVLALVQTLTDLSVSIVDGLATLTTAVIVNFSDSINTTLAGSTGVLNNVFSTGR